MVHKHNYEPEEAGKETATIIHLTQILSVDDIFLWNVVINEW